MSEGIRLRPSIVAGPDGKPEPSVSLDFGGGNGIEVRADVAIELGTAMIVHATGALDRLRIMEALEAAGLDDETVQGIVAEYSGVKQEPERRLDVVTDPDVVRNLNR